MNIGFYLIDINHNNESDIRKIQSLNNLCKLRPYDNIVLFNSQFNAVDTDSRYYTLHISEAKYFKGFLFLFDVKSALLTLNFPAPKKQILFLDSIDWQHDHKFPYSFWHNIYMNDNIELISTTKEINDLCKICWKDPLSYIENYDHEEINNVIQKL
jgi:hypothetical protein